MCSNLRFKNMRKKGKNKRRELGKTEQGNQKKEVSTQKCEQQDSSKLLACLSFKSCLWFLLLPTPPYFTDPSNFIQKALDQAFLLQQESYTSNPPLPHSNAKPLGKSKMQQPQTDAQKTRHPFNFFCKSNNKLVQRTKMQQRKQK